MHLHCAEHFQVAYADFFQFNIEAWQEISHHHHACRVQYFSFDQIYDKSIKCKKKLVGKSVGHSSHGRESEKNK